MTLPIISVAHKKIQMYDLLFMDVLELAKLETNHYQKQLRLILNRITGDSDLVDRQSVAERYAVFLTYLDIVKYNSLDESIVVKDYLNPDLNDFELQRVSNDKGTSVRHLMGVEAEALEIGCEGTDDWILGEMAITIGCKFLPPIETVEEKAVLSINYIARMIKNRLETIKMLSIDEFNDLVTQYLDLKSDLKTLVHFAFDDGIVLDKFGGGTEDAPVRFRASTAFYGHAKRFITLTNGIPTAI